MDDLLTRVQALFRRVFDDEQLGVDRRTTAADVDGWDSLMHINLLVATEKELGVRFATAEISELKEEGKNVGDFLDLLQSKLAARR